MTMYSYRVAPLVAILLALATGCHDATNPGGVPSRPSLTSHLDSLFSLGDTVRLAVNQPDSNLLWQTRNPNVAQVTQSGRVSAMTPGETWVLTFRDPAFADSAYIVVKQRLASLRVSPSAISRPLHRTQRFVAAGFDARGAPVPNVSVTWSTASAVAAIDVSGVATANDIGVTTIRAAVSDISATAQLTVTPLPALRFNRDTIDVGVGQYTDGQAVPPRVVADSLSPDETFTASLSVADPTVATLTAPTVPVPDLSGYPVSPQVQLIGRKPGVTTLTVTGGQYTAGNAVIRVSTPRLVITGATDWPANNFFPNNFLILTADSLGSGHNVTEPLAIHVRVRSPHVLSPSDTTLTINPFYDYAQLPFQRGDSGQTWVVISAPGYRDDSVHVRLTAPKLSFVRYDFSDVQSAIVGAAESSDGNLLVYARCCLPTDLPITITQLHAGVLRTPHSLLLPAMDNFGRIQLLTAGLAPGVDTLIASAPGYLPDTLPYIVTTPTYRLTNYPTTTTVGFPFTLGAFLADSLGNVNYPASDVAKALVISSNPSVLRPASDTLTIENSTGGGGVRVDIVGPGSATLTVRDVLGVFKPAVTPPIVVTPTKLLISSGYPSSSSTLSVGMHQLTGASVQLATGGTIPDSIHLRTTDPTVARPTVNAVPSLYNGTSFTIVGAERSGTAWIVASAPGLISDSLAVTVGKPAISVSVPLPVGGVGQTGILYVQLVDQTGSIRPTNEALTFRIVSSDPTVVTADSTITVSAGQYQSGWATIRYVGPGTAVLRVVDDRPVPYAYEKGASPLIQVPTPPSP